MALAESPYRPQTGALLADRGGPIRGICSRGGDLTAITGGVTKIKRDVEATARISPPAAEWRNSPGRGQLRALANCSASPFVTAWYGTYADITTPQNLCPPTQPVTRPGKFELARPEQLPLVCGIDVQLHRIVALLRAGARE